AIGHAIGLVGTRKPTAPDAKDQSPVADLVDSGGLLGKAQRMAERQNLHPGADLHPASARGNSAGDRRSQEHTSELQSLTRLPPALCTLSLHVALPISP